MTYSSAVFARDDMSLEEAQREKYRRLAEAADTSRRATACSDRFGWGRFAAYLAGEVRPT